MENASDSNDLTEKLEGELSGKIGKLFARGLPKSHIWTRSFSSDRRAREV